MFSTGFEPLTYYVANNLFFLYGSHLPTALRMYPIIERKSTVLAERDPSHPGLARER